ncbi:MAG: hypothetical protein AB1758_20510 [Candidatus Eremiobacterota bacterium]
MLAAIHYLNLARDYAAEGLWDTAREAASLALEGCPDLDEASLIRATAHLRDHRVGHALRDVNRVLWRRPRDARALALRARAWAQAGMWDWAEEDLRAAVHLDPEHAGELRRLLHRRDRDHPHRLRNLELLLEKHPWHGTVHLEYARRLREAGRHAAALQACRMARDLGPCRHSVHMEEYLIQWEAGEVASAVQSLHQAVHLRPEPRAYRLLSARLCEIGWADEGLMAARSAVAHSHDPDERRRSLLHLSSCLPPEEAVETLRELDRLGIGKLPRLLYHAIWCRALMGVEDLPAAHRHLNEAERLGLESDAVALTRCDLLLAEQRFEAAHAVARAGLERHPDQADLLARMALLAERLGRPQEADDHVRRCRAPSLADLQILTEWAEVRGHSAMPELARALVRAGLQAPAHAAMAQFHQSQGRADEARQEMDKALCLAPESPEMLQGRAQLLREQGDEAAARRDEREAERLVLRRKGVWLD